jgi:hypothetical protein
MTIVKAIEMQVINNENINLKEQLNDSENYNEQLRKELTEYKNKTYIMDNSLLENDTSESKSAEYVSDKSLQNESKSDCKYESDYDIDPEELSD